MAVLLVYAIHCLCMFSIYADRYNGSLKEYSSVPHDLIQADVIEIYLNKNLITELHANEFSAYTALTLLQIKHNKIHTISPSAFSGTQLVNLDISGNRLTVVPDLAAVSGTLKFLTMQSNDLNENSNLTELESISLSLQQLDLKFNKFATFPNLPMPVRRKLKNLWLGWNQISVIPDHVISGYKLYRLGLNRNMITTITDELLSIVSSHISVGHNPYIDWDQYSWNKLMCGHPSLESMDLYGSMNNLAQMPDIYYSICNRTGMLKIDLGRILGRCDCSVQWMADALHQGCPVKFEIKGLQCGSQLQDLNLTCPKSGMTLYKDEHFAGESFMVDNKTSRQAFHQPIMSIAVLGEQAWVLHSSLLFNLSAPHKILLPGRYANLQKAGISNFLPVAAEPYVPTLSVTVSSSQDRAQDACVIDDSLKLLDDDPSTCITVKGVLQLTVSSTEPVHQLIILTREMDCAKGFHVSVSVRRPLNQCPNVDVAQLTSHSVMNSNAEFSESVYSVPQGGGDIMIRLAAVHKAYICSVTHTIPSTS